MKMRLATPALLMAGLLVFAACGDDDDDSGSILGGGATAAEDRDAEASDTTVDDSSSDDASDDTTDEGSSSGEFSGDDSGDFCDFAQDVQDDVDLDNLGATDADPSQLEDEFGQGRDALEEAADRAPDEIKDDVENLRDFFQRFDDLMSEYDYDFTQLIADAQSNPDKLAEFEALSSDAELTASTERFETYLSEVCGITE